MAEVSRVHFPNSVSILGLLFFQRFLILKVRLVNIKTNFLKLPILPFRFSNHLEFQATNVAKFFRQSSKKTFCLETFSQLSFVEESRFIESPEMPPSRKPGPKSTLSRTMTTKPGRHNVSRLRLDH